MNSLISIIIPTIGRDTLRRTLLSIYKSNYSPSEIIVVTDTSKLDKVNPILSHFKNVKLITNSHPLLPAQAKNLGLKQSQGKYVTFLDDDDICYPNKLFLLSKFLDENPDYFAVFGKYDVYGVNGLLKNKGCGGSSNPSFDSLMENNYIASGAIMLRNTEAVRFDENLPYGWGEDFVLWGTLLGEKYKIEFVDKTIYGWTQNIQTGFTATFNKEGIDWKKLSQENKERLIRKYRTKNENLNPPNLPPPKVIAPLKYKIALFYSSYGKHPAGGTTARSYAIVKMLNKFNCEFKTFINGNPHKDYVIPNRLFKLDTFNKHHFNIYWVEQGFEFIRHLNNQNIQPILGSNIVPCSAPMHCIPYLDEPGRIRQPGQVKSEKEWIRTFKGKFWLSQSDFQEKEYRRLGLPYEIKVFRAPNPVDVESFHPCLTKLPNPIIGWTGKVNWAKHPLFLKEIASQFPQIKFLYFSDEITDLDFGSNVNKIIGNTRVKMPDLLRQCSMFISTSVTENQPLGILEAMATGLPVIAFRTSGIPEIIKENETGVLVDLGNIEHFVVEIQRLLNNSEKQQYLGKNARNYVVENFSEEVCMKQYTKIFEEYLK